VPDLFEKAFSVTTRPPTSCQISDAPAVCSAYPRDLQQRLELRDVLREVHWSGASDFPIDFRSRGIPAGHGNGAYNAIHLTIVRCITLEEELTDLCPETMRKESQRWQIIWCADIRPQRP